MFEHGEKCESLVIRGMKEETFQAERNNVSATLDRTWHWRGFERPL